MLAGGDPVPLGGRVNLENMGPGAEDRLLPGGEKHRGDDEICKENFGYIRSVKVQIPPENRVY